jgi:hypothetical protein
MMCVLSKFGSGVGAGRWQLIVMGDPFNSGMHAKGVRQELIRRTRPDLLRPVHIDFGVMSAEGIKAADRGGTSDPYVAPSSLSTPPTQLWVHSHACMHAQFPSQRSLQHSAGVCVCVCVCVHEC